MDLSKLATPTKKAGRLNATKALQDGYSILMSINSAPELEIRAVAIVAGAGIGNDNLIRFRKTISELANERDLDRMRGYITNFVLSGSGMAVLGSQRH